jgi:hypothetical protein
MATVKEQQQLFGRQWESGDFSDESFGLTKRRNNQLTFSGVEIKMSI